ncbi:Asparaginase family protein [Aphelenchoides avenae]|nr:Asparaginase family protein [Aphelenchus avenae]
MKDVEKFSLSVVATRLVDTAAKLEYFQQSTATQFPLLDAVDAYGNVAEFEDLLHAMLSHLSSMDSTLFGSKGEASAKPYCLFITGLSERFPAFLHRNLSYVVPFLNFDPPSLRSAVLTAFTDILLRCYTGELQPRLQKERDALLERLRFHIDDANAVVRSKALHLWQKLAVGSIIPNSQFRMLLIAEISKRLTDNSVMSRKAAANVLTAIVMYNGFGAELNWNVLHERLVDVEKQRRDLLAKNPEFDLVAQAHKKFQSIENEVKEILKGCVETGIHDAEMIEANGFGNVVAEMDPLEPVADGADPSQDPQMLQVARAVLETEGRVRTTALFYHLCAQSRSINITGDRTVDDVVKELLEKLRELVIKHIVAERIQHDDAMLVEEDRVQEYNETMSKLMEKIEVYLDSLLFASEIERCLPAAVCAMRQGQVPEMQEMIKFICECRKFRVRGSDKAINQVCALIWRKDNSIVELVTEALFDTFFSQNQDEALAAPRTSQNLLDVMLNATVEDLVSFEEALRLIISKKGVSRDTMECIWSCTKAGKQNVRIAAVRLVAIIARAQPDLVRPDFARLVKLYSSPSPAIRVEVLRALSPLASKANTDKMPEMLKAPFRFSPTHRVFRLMILMLVRDFPLNVDEFWIPHAKEALSVVYSLCSEPMRVISFITQKFVRQTENALRRYRNSLKLFVREKRRISRVLAGERVPSKEDARTLDQLLSPTQSEERANKLESRNEAISPAEEPGPSTSAQSNHEQPEPMDVDENAQASNQPNTDAENVEVLRKKLTDISVDDLPVLEYRLKHLEQWMHNKKRRWELCASRLLFWIGDVALKFIGYLEITFVRELKKALQAVR